MNTFYIQCLLRLAPFACEVYLLKNIISYIIISLVFSVSGIVTPFSLVPFSLYFSGVVMWVVFFIVDCDCLVLHVFFLLLRIGRIFVFLILRYH